MSPLPSDLTPSAPPTGGARRARVLGTCAGFAECRRASTRQRSIFAECRMLPTADTRQRTGMPCAWFLPSARGLALGKPHLCRVPVVWHSAKTETLGNYRFSGGARAYLYLLRASPFPGRPICLCLCSCLMLLLSSSLSTPTTRPSTV